jgi:NifU-like protein
MLEQSEQSAATAVADQAGAAASQRLKLIEQAIEELRPYLRADGGDCELVGVDGDLVKVRLKGACVGCQLSHVTINGVQERLIAKLGRPLRIIPVKGAH